MFVILIQSLDSIDNGKTYNDALEDVDFSIESMRYYAGWADKIHGQTIPVGEYQLIYKVNFKQ